MDQHTTPLSPTPASRLYFLDWVRIFAFMLLIAYHTGMYYVTWGFHIKSDFASDAIEPLMMLSSPWRLSLLFMISGVASAFMLKKLTASQFMRQRSSRLLIPLLFGMLVIVPPQSYFEVVEKVAYQGSYLDFMQLYLKGYHGFCDKDGCLRLPTWNHLWFVVYLWTYSIVLGALMLSLGKRFDAISEFLGRWLSGWKIILIPLAILALERITLFSQFPSTHALVNDWYNHANYFVVFLLGALMATQTKFWASVDQQRWINLGLALSCWSLLIVYYAIGDKIIPAAQIEFWRHLQRVVYALCQWSAILAVCGFAHQHLQFDSSKRRYLTEAVFPVYILHQTLIIAMAHFFKPAKLNPVLEGMILITLTITLSFGLFEIVRRIAVLRPLFGLAKIKQAQSQVQDANQAVSHSDQAAVLNLPRVPDRQGV